VKKATTKSRLLLKILFINKNFKMNDLGLKKVHGSQPKFAANKWASSG